MIPFLTRSTERVADAHRSGPGRSQCRRRARAFPGGGEALALPLTPDGPRSAPENSRRGRYATGQGCESCPVWDWRAGPRCHWWPRTYRHSRRLLNRIDGSKFFWQARPRSAGRAQPRHRPRWLYHHREARIRSLARRLLLSDGHVPPDSPHGRLPFLRPHRTVGDHRRPAPTTGSASPASTSEHPPHSPSVRRRRCPGTFQLASGWVGGGSGHRAGVGPAARGLPGHRAPRRRARARRKRIPRARPSPSRRSGCARGEFAPARSGAFPPSCRPLSW
ncbi:hypothetical protein DFR75_1173 [Nocardia ignorata]|uniref:Uncharacterized protein n=1 Tax=Nocardia ignorata TaxID=145285 RepID=A0A4R6P1Y5_NOCIG|nr:hypothetical protein DFR75_1173 [Nocardia ignorata]